MKIKEVLFAAGNSAFYFDDQRAIKAGASKDGFLYQGDPITEGFTRVRQAGEAISIMLVLENGRIGVGDCAAVQYSGAGGRDKLFVAQANLPFLEEHVKPLLKELDISNFRQLVENFDTIKVQGKQLHTAIRYGITQAILSARALAAGKTMCEIVCQEWNLKPSANLVPIFAQSGDDRYVNVDKMILKGADILPHALINNLEEKVGKTGEKLRDYISWLSDRIHSVRLNETYKPTIHIDVYGTIGLLFDNNTDKVADYLASLQDSAKGLDLYIEGPIDMEQREKQIDALGKVKSKLTQLGSPVKIVADEWCNTLEDIKLFTDAKCCDMVQIKTPDLGGINNIIDAVVYCKQRNMGAYQGGTCNETDISARTCVHLAMATKPDLMLAKPGMGFDEGYTIVNNEMRRISAIIDARLKGSI